MRDRAGDRAPDVDPREFWGQGLATEVATSFLEAAFGPLALRDVVAFTLPSNRASRRVMEKLGLHYEREVLWTAVPHVLYRRMRGAST